jgi:hypothetical protein
MQCSSPSSAPGSGLARSLPALAGIAIVALPALWRKQLGEIGALSAAALLFISPLALFAARRVDSASIGALGAGVIVTLLMHSATGERDGARWRRGLLAVGGAGLAIGLISGPTFYDLLIPGVLAWFLVQARRPQHPVQIPWRAFLAGVGAALMISIAFGLRWSGWSGLTDGAMAWLITWRVHDPTQAPTLGLLTLYEPLLLALWLAGFILLWGITPHQTPDADGVSVLSQPPLWSLALWGLLSLFLNVLRPGSTTESLSATLIPISLLGGYSAQHLWDGVRSESRRWVYLHILVSFLLWLPGLLALAQHASGFAYTDQALLVIVGGAVLIGLQILLILLFTLLITPSEAWRGTFFGGAAILLLLQASFAFGLAYVRPNSPIEPAVTTTTSRDVAQLRNALHTIAFQRGQRVDDLPVILMEGDADATAVLRWHLREFATLKLSHTWAHDPRALVITKGDGDLPVPPDPESWRGMPFVALSAYDEPTPRCSRLLPPQCSAALRWYLYRTSPSAVRSSRVILWQSETGARW